MHKPYRAIALLLAATVIVQIVIHFLWVSPRLNESLQKIAETKESLDAALQNVQHSRRQVDSLRMNILKFNNYLMAIQAQTEVLYKENELREGRFKLKRDSILAEVNRAKAQADTIVLPILTVYDSRTRKQ